MNRTFAPSLLAAVVVAAAALGSSGCIVGECDSGQDNCVQAESTIEYTGKAASKSVAYAAGQNVRISSHNGQVDVNVGGSEVAVTFEPFTRNKDSQEGEDAATDELSNDLVLEVTEGGTIEVKVGTTSGASSFLGAHIKVTLPSAFDGAFEVAQNNGSVDVDLRGTSPSSTKIVSGNGGIDVLGAAGDLTIDGDNGSMTVGVSDWATSGEGSIRCGNGNLTLTVPSDADGALSLVADGETTAQVPSDWTEESNDTGTTYTMGSGSGAWVTATTEFGDIDLSTN